MKTEKEDPGSVNLNYSEKYLNQILNGNHRMLEVENYGKLCYLEGRIKECYDNLGGIQRYNHLVSEYSKLCYKLNIFTP